MISQTAEYALRAAVCLADAGKPLTTHQIGGVTRVPLGYLSKVLQALGRAGIVQSQRGLHGGFGLARPADQLSILEVINAVDPFQRIMKCPLDLTSHGARLCPLHRRLDDAMSQVEKSFAETTLADLLRTESASRPLCETGGKVKLHIGGPRR